MQTTSQWNGENTGWVNPGLLELLETGKLDWDDMRHRAMFLQTWITGALRPYLKGER